MSRSRTVPVDGVNVQITGSVDLGGHIENRAPIVGGPDIDLGRGVRGIDLPTTLMGP